MCRAIVALLITAPDDVTRFEHIVALAKDMVDQIEKENTDENE